MDTQSIPFWVWHLESPSSKWTSKAPRWDLEVQVDIAPCQGSRSEQCCRLSIVCQELGMMNLWVLCLGSARLVGGLLGVGLWPAFLSLGRRCLVQFGCIPLGVIKVIFFSEKTFDSFLEGWELPSLLHPFLK